MKDLEVSEYIGIDEGYHLLIRTILDVPEWYHETHEMLDAIVAAKPSNEECRKYLGVNFNTLRSWRNDYIEFTKEIYEKIARMYEDLPWKN